MKTVNLMPLNISDECFPVIRADVGLKPTLRRPSRESQLCKLGQSQHDIYRTLKSFRLFCHVAANKSILDTQSKT